MKHARAGNRIRKRTFVVAGLTLLAIVLLGGLLTLYVVSMLGPADLARFSIEEGQDRTEVIGCGVSLSEAETANYLQDASFEPLVFRQSLTIYSGDATTLTVSSEEASAGLYGDGFFDQAVARVMTQTADGLVLKKNARVVHYGINRVGIFQSVSLPGDVPDNLAFLAFARREETSLAVGEQGLIVLNITGQTPEIIESGLTADLTGVCADAGGFMACSAAGDLLQSDDGLVWNKIPSFNHRPLRAVAVSDEQVYVAAGDGGTLVVCQNGQANVLPMLTKADMTDIVYGLGVFVAVGRDGTILISHTGLIWQNINLNAQVNWQTIDFRDGRFILAGDKGAIAASDDGRAFQMLSQLSQTTYMDVVMLSKQQMILLDQTGGFSVTNDSGQTWLQSSIATGMHSQVIALAGKDKILSADDSGQLGIAPLVAEIQLDSPLKEGQYQSGDLLFLEKTSAGIPSAYLAGGAAGEADYFSWNLYGSGISQRISGEAAPNGGDAALLLQAVDDGRQTPAILSQAIDADRLDSLQQNELLQIELWMKQSDVADRQVQVWLSGPFTPVGTTFVNVGTSWKKYQFTFLLPVRDSSGYNDEIRLNFSIGSGSLWLDRVYFGAASESTDLVTKELQQLIGTIQPQVMRLDFLGIGSSATPAGSWAQPAGNEAPRLVAGQWESQAGGSLHAAMKLTQACGADPWLVIDSYTSEAELLNLIEYLAGPISEPYGKRRQELGAVVPWTETFNRLFIEICDSDNVFTADYLKSDFVNLMIKTISESPYYQQIKNKLIFIDGMAYSDGVVLSTADYHASDLSGLILDDYSQALDDAFQIYYDQIPRNPDKPGQNWPELIRSATLQTTGTRTARLADLVDLILRDLGNQSGLANLAMPALTSQGWQSAWIQAARVTSACAQGTPLPVARLTVDASQNTAEVSTDDDVQVYAFRSSQSLSVALVNRSDQTVTSRLITDLPLDGAALEKYDANGILLSRQTLKHSDSNITILPGGMVYLKKTLIEPE